MKILIFLHGTIIMHKNALGKTREERVKQVLDGEESIYDFSSYVPVGNSVQKLQEWAKQNADIYYLSSNRNCEDIEKDKCVLQLHGFPNGQVIFCQDEETYKDIVERIMPNILIEDDCESIGGEKEMVYPHIKQDLKYKVKLIPVKEFGGIDQLPSMIIDLANYKIVFTNNDLIEFENVLKKSWSKDTSYYPSEWHESNPSFGQCAVTTLVINDYFGGEILWAEAILPNGKKVSHYFNYINERELDLTRVQFPKGTIIPKGIKKKTDYSTIRDYMLSYENTKMRYELLKDRVRSNLA